MSLFSFFAGKFLFALAALLPIINPQLAFRQFRQRQRFAVGICHADADTGIDIHADGAITAVR